MASARRLTTSLPGVAVRPATRADATHITALCDIAGEGLPSALWRRSAAPTQSAFEYGRNRILSGETNFNLRNSLIAEHGGEVAGLMLGYPLPVASDVADWGGVPDVIVPLLELEAEVPGYWYLNILAVYPEFRRKGIARLLLTVVDEIGATARAKGLVLIAASVNTGAFRLYESAGYRVKARRQAIVTPDIRIGGEWWLMTKPL
jgi:ribosomal protein S18 acetylase RimI-like enzyme